MSPHLQKRVSPTLSSRLVCAAFCLCRLGLAQADAPPYPEARGYVNDFAEVLSSQAAGQIAGIAKNLEAQTTVELAVVTVDSTAPAPLKDYAVGLLQHWGIGKKDRDNGVLFIVAVKDRRVEIEVGYGLEGVLTDGLCGQILDRHVVPHFRNRKDDWSSGMLGGTKAIRDVILQGDWRSARKKMGTPAPAHAGGTSGLSPFFRGLYYTACFLLIAWVCCFLPFAIVKCFALPKCPKCGRRRHVVREWSSIVFAPYARVEMEEIVYYCKACDYRWRRRRMVPRRRYVESTSSYDSSWSSGGSSGSDSGSSFGGFGGGSSGGAGAGRSF